MSTNTTIGILAAGAFVILLGVALFMAVDFDGPGLAGIGIGAAIGLLNLVVGLWLTSRALRVGGKSVLRTMLGGFFARFVTLAVLIVVFHSMEAVNEIGFGITFMIFFMIFMGLEVRLVEKSLRRAA
ncbi:MAG: hypothetical protein ACYTHK_01340 [Planctomycetota bacterium]